MRHLIFSLVLAGCASTQSRPEPAPQPSQPQGQLEHGMRNCPNALAGTTTNLTNTQDGVDLEITANDPAIQQQIVQLAMVQAHMGKPNKSEMEHTGMHGGPGDMGYCPIIHTATMVTFDEVKGGAVIHVRAQKPEDVSNLQTNIASRVARLATR